MYEERSSNTMDVHEGIPSSYLRSRQRLCNAKSICLVMFMMSLISTTNAIKCYVCGTGSELPFLEAKSSNVNETYIKQKIHKSCDEFDRIPLDQKYKYEMECPDNFMGCLLNVGGDVQRTCTPLGIDDCKKANGVHYCYCNHQLCNGENAESIIEKYGDGDTNDDENDDYVENEEAGSGSDQEDDDDNYPNTSRKIDSSETSTHGGTTEHNKIAILSVSTTTAQPTINKAVNSNLSRNLLIFLTFAHLIIVCHQN